MKKLVVFMLTLLVLFALAACGGQAEETPTLVEEPPTLTDRRFHAIHHNIVEGRALVMLDEDTIAIIDVASGEEILHFDADIYHFEPSNLLPDGMARFILTDGVIMSRLVDIATGDDVLPLGTTYFVGSVREGMAVVSNRRNHRVALLDIATGERIIPFGTYEQELFWQRSACGTVFLFPFDGGRETSAAGIVDIVSGVEVIPLGSYMFIGMMTEDIAIVTSGTPSADSTCGILEISSGRYLLPHGRYNMSWRGYYNYATGAVLARLGDRSGVIDIASGEEIIPFGYYDEIRSLFDGIFAVSRDDVWWFTRISNYLN